MTGLGDDPSVLLDVHHLGLQQTGNESWARNAVVALEADGKRSPHYAVTRAASLPATVPPSRRHEVSTSSLRRLAVDMPRLLRTLRPDAVLAQYTLPPGRTPGVVVVHDLSFEDPLAGQWIPWPTLQRYRLSIRSSARRAGCVIVATEWTRTDMLQRYQLEPRRVVVCPIAVAPDLALLLQRAATLRAEQPPDPHAPVVLCVGTVLPRKNLVVVAAAVAQLRREGSPVSLRLVGKTPPAGQADAARITALLGTAVTFTGHVDEAQLVEEYRRASVLCFPSLYEGFGVPLLEAMTATVPVISSSATCLPEVGGDAALYAAPNDIDVWASTIAAVLGDTDVRETMTIKGLTRTEFYASADVGPAIRRAIAVAVS